VVQPTANKHGGIEKGNPEQPKQALG